MIAADMPSLGRPPLIPEWSLQLVHGREMAKAISLGRPSILMATGLRVGS